MKGIRHIFQIAAVLLVALSAGSCNYRDIDHDGAQIEVSLYIPDAVLTKAETGHVDPLAAEKEIHSLDIWVFLHGAVQVGNTTYPDGTFVSYRHFGAGFGDTGLSNSTITRFGMPLEDEMFVVLTTPGVKVDVYAVANIASVTNASIGETTTRADLDAMVLSDAVFGASPLTKSVPASGLPMSGVLKGADVTGGYPVLNVSTVTLKRAVSKIRFVFCQQSDGSTHAFNSNCRIKSISFDGVSNGHDCQIAAEELLFTDRAIGIKNGVYTPLATTLYGENGASLIPNGSIALAEYPEEYIFQSIGHETETAQQYETRLASLGNASQAGPIYIRETDKLISGTITYCTEPDPAGGSAPEKTAAFSLVTDALGNFDALSRNHSWILYAYFAEETRTLKLTVVVSDWTWTGYDVDYKSGSVNVIRRFTVSEHVPATFTKRSTNDGFFDIRFWHTIDVVDEQTQTTTQQYNVIEGNILIATPVGQKLIAVPVPGAESGQTVLNPNLSGSYKPLFKVIVKGSSPESSEATIYPNWANPEDGKIEHCLIEYQIEIDPWYLSADFSTWCSNNNTTPEAMLAGQFIDLHFTVKINDGLTERYIDLDSESIDRYRIILDTRWNDMAYINALYSSGNG